MTLRQISPKRGKIIHKTFEAQVQQTPQKTAILLPKCGEQPQQKLSYQSLNDRANRLAHILQQQGVEVGTYVALMMERSLETIVALLGILKAGGVYVPLDPAYPPDRLEWMLSDTQAPVILTQARLISRLPSHQATIIKLESAWGEECTAGEQTEISANVTPESIAYINYTSGSTGRPKGVAIPHRAVSRLVFGTDYTPLHADQTWLQLAPLSFDAATLEIWGALLHGGKCVLFPSNGLPDPQDLKTVITDHQVTSLWLTASLFNAIISETPQALQGVKELLTGGEALSIAHVRLAQAHLPNTQLVNGYGPTENTTFTCCYRIPAPLADDLTSIPIGQPIGGTQVYILDTELQPVPAGSIGELYVGGEGLAAEYINRPELTQLRFIQNPFSTLPDTKLYRTGDLVRTLSDGNLEFMGRIDDQVKIRGHRIELGEIERTLCEHGSVRDAVVIVDEAIPAQKRLVAYLTGGPEVNLDLDSIKDYLEQKLPQYMRPAALVGLDNIPLTINGKVDKKQLPQPRFEATANFVAPRTPMEHSLEDLWCTVLGLTQVGIEDNFFEVGGTSILGLQIIARLQTQLNQTVRAVKLYQYPTIRTLAQYLTTPERPQPSNAQFSENTTNPSQTLASTEIAIVGMVGRFPGANTVTELWSNLCDGLEEISFLAEDQIDPSVDSALSSDPNYVKARGVLQGAEEFDAKFFGISPREAEVMDPQARVFLELAQEALESTGYAPSQYSGQIGLYAGSGQNTYFERHLCGRSEIVDRLGAFQTMLANEKDFLTTRTSYKLNLTGPSISVSTACSTSLVATIQACQGLRNHDCDLALAGGVSITTPQNTGYLYQEEGMLSPDGHCRPFDAQAQGTTFNSGAGIVVLKRLADAIEDCDRIYAVIKGVGMNNDGAGKVSFTAPSVEGQAAAIQQAQQQAGFAPESIDYIEAHGTATPLGDPIEIEALTQAFHHPLEPSCAIGSIKSNIGHTVAAAGVAGLIKTSLALYHKMIPPSLGFTTPNPNIDFENSPFFVNTKLTDWPIRETPGRAGVSSFGVGGTNAHVVLEEPPKRVPSGPSRPLQLLRLSAKTQTALEQMTLNLQQHLQEQADLNLADVAFTLHTGRESHNYRRFVIGQNLSDASAALASLEPETSGSRETLQREPEIAFVFPGQGSQYINMGHSFYQGEPIFRQTVDRCAEILQPVLELDIRTLLYPAGGEEEKASMTLKQTRYTQPALFVVEYALAQLWMSWGITPSAMMGHSIGEFVAACLAGVFSLEDSLKLIATRGLMMWDLAQGSMLSVRLSANQVKPFLTGGVELAAINSPVLCVLSGPTPEISALEATLTAQEIVSKPLHTSHAFHSAMMDEIVAPLEVLIAKISLSPPHIPFVSTVTGEWITQEQATDPHYWARHLRATVRFADGIQTLWQQPRILLEIGPRKTTTTLARQQIKDRGKQVAIATLDNTASDNREWAATLHAMGQLWLQGVELKGAAFYQHEIRHRVPLPSYPFERQRFWIDPKPALDHNTAIDAESAAKLPEATPQPPVSTTSSPIAPLEPIMTSTRIQRLTPLIHDVIETTSGLEILEEDAQATFLEMGLDSLSLTQMALALKKKFKVKISFRNLLEDHCTVESVATFLDQSLPAEAFPAPPSASTDVASSAGTAPDNTTETTLPSASTVNASSTRPLGGGTVEALVAQQLQIMSQQLALLSQEGAETSILPQNSPNAPRAEIPSPDTEKAAAPSSPAESKSHGPGAKIIKSQETTLSEAQKTFLQNLIERYNTRTQESKHQTQEHRPYLADPRTVSGFSPLLKEMVYPIVVERSSGAKLWDVDGNEYIDLTNGFGLNFFGWNPDFVTQAIVAQIEKGIEIGPQTPLAGRVAKLITEFTGLDRVAFCNTGSEAVMASLRLARTVTGRNLVVTFKGDYHGTFDEVLYRPGAKMRTLPAAPGIMPSMFENLLVLEYGSPESLEILRQKADEVAAVLIEPVRSRDPGLQPKEYLQELRQITQEAEIALIFDEVVTGFRVTPGGAQAYFGVQADLATYGKIVGGGLPIGIVAGKSEFMDALDGGQWQFGDDSIPEVGVTFFAGTFVRHPMALAAAEAILLKLKSIGPQPQKDLANTVTQFTQHLTQYCQQVEAPVVVKSFSSFFYITYTDEAPYGGLLFYLLRSKGVHIWEYRPCFFTLAHTNEDIEVVTQAFKDSVNELQQAGLLPGIHHSPNGNQGKHNPNIPPCPGARLGRDPQGCPAWFIPDQDRPGQYLQVGESL